jgi:hypothetical protein
MNAYIKYELKDRSGRVVKDFTVGPAGQPCSHQDAQKKIQNWLRQSGDNKIEIKGSN